MREGFSFRLKKAMLLNEITAADLSKKTGIKPPMISDYLSGKYKPKQDNAYILAKTLDVNEAWLMGFDADIERITDNEKKDINNKILYKLKKLNDEQKNVIINIIDNMK